MAKKQENKQNQGAPVEQLQCKAEGCKAKPFKFGFCKDHYEMYMAGVIRGDGTKPVDYEHKLAQYIQQRQKQAA
jgi:hypothetical protein